MYFGDTTFHSGYKDHRCEWCGETIPKGEKFAHYKGQWQGDWQNWRMHLECSEASSTDYIQDGFEPFAYKRGSQEDK